MVRQTQKFFKRRAWRSSKVSFSILSALLTGLFIFFSALLTALLGPSAYFAAAKVQTVRSKWRRRPVSARNAKGISLDL